MSRKSRIRKEYRKKNFNKLNAEYQVCSFFDCTKDENVSGSVPYCIALDKLITSLNTIIANEAAKQLAADARPSKRSTIEKAEKLQILRDIRKARELAFTEMSCPSKIDDAEFLETKDIILDGFDDIDEDVFSEGNKQTNTLFFIGAGVLLTALTITLILTRKK